MKKMRKTGIKRLLSAAVVSALVVAALGYTFVSSAANTITLASSGRFEYDADGNGEINGAAGDVILDSDDLVALKDAVTGLNSSLTAISTKAYGADGVPNYTGQLKDALGNLISGDPDDLESKYYSYQTSHSYTNTQYEQNANQIIETVAGNATADCIYHLDGHALGMTFQQPKNSSWNSSSFRGQFLIWSGNYTAAELVAGISSDGIDLKNYATMSKWSTRNAEVGFMGRMLVASVSNATNGGSGITIDYFSDKIHVLNSESNYVSGSIFTLAPLITQ